MTTQEAIKLVAEEWDNVIDDRGAVCVVIGPDKDIDAEFRRLKKHMKGIDYHGSYGVKRKQEKNDNKE